MLFFKRSGELISGQSFGPQRQKVYFDILKSEAITMVIWLLLNMPGGFRVGYKILPMERGAYEPGRC